MGKLAANAKGFPRMGLVYPHLLQGFPDGPSTQARDRARRRRPAGPRRSSERQARRVGKGAEGRYGRQSRRQIDESPALLDSSAPAFRSDRLTRKKPAGIFLIPAGIVRLHLLDQQLVTSIKSGEGA
jgi:hypothetical protein